MRHRPGTTHSWARSPVAAGQARPDTRHQTPATTSQLSLQHGARVVPRAASAPSPALAVWFAIESISVESEVCVARDVACSRPPSRPLLHLSNPPRTALALVDDCGFVALWAWGSNHGLGNPCSQLTNPALAIFETRSHFSRCYPAGHARIRPLFRNRASNPTANNKQNEPAPSQLTGGHSPHPSPPGTSSQPRRRLR